MMRAFDIEEEVQTFTEEELRFFNKGYLAAIEGLLEQITDDQIKLLNRIHQAVDDSNTQVADLLQSRLKVLDIYEKHYKSRLKQLRSDAE